MNDREAAAIIKSLIPDLQASGPQALVKYAKAQDLPSALLEKLAQVANRLVTLHHIETNQDRGSPVPLFDVPEIVRGYELEAPEKKAAAAPRPTHDPASVDLMSLFVKETGVGDFLKVASSAGPLECAPDLAALLVKLQMAHWEADTSSNEHATLGVLYEALQACLDRYVEAAMGHNNGDLSSATVDIDPNADVDVLMADIRRAVDRLKLAAKKVDSDALLNIAAEMEEQVSIAAYKLKTPPEKSAAITDGEIEEAANNLYGSAVMEREKAALDLVALLSSGGDGNVASVANAEREAIAEGFDPTAVKSAFDWLCGGIRKAAAADRFEGNPVRVRSMSAGTRLSDAVGGFVESHTLVNLARDASVGFAKASSSVALHDDELDDEPTVRPVSDAEYVGDADTATTHIPAEDVQQPRETERERAPRQADPASSPAKEKGTVDDKPSKAEGSAKDWAGLIAAPVGRVADSVSTAADMANSAISGITGKERQNKAQQKADMSVDDIVRTIMVRRLVTTDPILREADPRRVMEVYNAIARIHPGVAADPAQLRLALREAVSYDGLTLDSQKLLADTRKSEEDATAKARDNARNKYSVGGSELTQLLKTPTLK